MRRLVLGCLFLACFASSSATHIVGGEFELEHVENYTYQLRLILYFDDVYGDPLAEDLFVEASVFSKKSNDHIESFILENRGSAYVEYSNPECVYDSLSTRRILYSRDITLPPEIYNDPEGYYVIWERCCRNNVIDNIVAPEAAGQVFYLEFPPVLKNGRPFVNSSPVLFPPLSDYACIGQDYYVDFRGVDKDGDSLTYSLVTPMAGHTNNQDNPVTPFPMSRPYEPVQWQNEIDINNMVPGDQPLQISKNGILTVNPSFEGLFVFGVKCEEFRNGEKIGEVRRDFQMLVISCNDPGSPPEVMMKLAGEEQFYNETDTIKITNAESGCFTVFVTDPDPAEKISFRAYSVNFTDQLEELFAPYSGVISNPGDTLKLDICLPECPAANREIAVLDLIAMDDACSQPLTDSIRLIIDYRNILNSAPYFTVDQDTVNYNLLYNDALKLVLEGKDDDLSNLNMQLLSVNFDLQEYDVDFKPRESEPGSIAYDFGFDTDCAKYDFTKQDTFQVALLLLDEDSCGYPSSDTLVINMVVDLPENAHPTVEKSLDSDDAVIRINGELEFSVNAFDEDHDLVYLYAVGEGFDLEEYGMTFENKTNFGSATSEFSWTPDCSLNLPQKDNFTVLFIAEDQDACFGASADTTRINMEVRPPQNNRPVVSINVFTDSLALQVGQTLDFRVTAYDTDGDSIYLDLHDNSTLTESFSVSFESQEGVSALAGIFSYTPTCEHLNEDMSPRDLEFRFFVNDNKCYNPRSDTTDIKITVIDIPGGYDNFNPPNVFSPNGDEFNPTFTLPDLPSNNCRGSFHEIQIFNRWGGLVYQSTDKNFSWDGGGNSSGVYYYVIRYSTFRYKGSVSILR